MATLKARSGFGSQTLDVKWGDVFALSRLMEAGLPFRAIERFHQASGLAIADVAGLVRIPPRTLVRRRARGRLLPDESERLLRISRLFDEAVDLFEGDVDAARNWLATPKRAFGGRTPLDFARTEVGAREVENLLGRLAHGVFS